MARTTVNGYQERRSRAELLSIHALHEWDPKKMGNKSLWSKTIDSTVRTVRRRGSTRVSVAFFMCHPASVVGVDVFLLVCSEEEFSWTK